MSALHDVTVWAMLERGSSPIDWCEENYTFSANIAEFVNTFSNILFLVLPPLLIHLFREYGKMVNPAIHLIWTSFIIVGLASAYFHATLSLVGQLLDELTILWAYYAAFTLFFPRKLFPDFMQNSRIRFALTTMTLGLVLTVLSVLHPAVNALVLMALSVPSVVILLLEVKRQDDVRIRRLGIRCATAWVFAMFCWINDWLFCNVWSAIKFLYLHGLWHIVICIAAIGACVIGAYLSVREEKPGKAAVLRYWPRNDFEFGVPYVLVKSHDDYNDKI